jgi:hypothetical protein
MRIAGLKKYQRRDRRGFSDLPLVVRLRAEAWLHKWCRRNGGRPEPYRWALWIGQARRLAKNPPTSGWGRSMRAKMAGKALQQIYRQQGLTGPEHPAAKASAIRSANIQREKAQRARREEWQRRMGVPASPMPRTVRLNMWL